MMEDLLRRMLEEAERSGRRGWILVGPGGIVGTFRDRTEAIKGAREPGIYLLIHR